MTRKKKPPKDTFELEIDFEGWDNKSKIAYTTTYYYYDDNDEPQSQQEPNLTSLQIPKDKEFILDLMKILIQMMEKLKWPKKHLEDSIFGNR